VTDTEVGRPWRGEPSPPASPEELASAAAHNAATAGRSGVRLVYVGEQLVHPQRVSAITITRGGSSEADLLIDDDDGAAMKLRAEVYWPDVDPGGIRRGTGREKVDPAEDLRCWETVGPPWWSVTVLFSGGGTAWAGTCKADSWKPAELNRTLERARVLQSRTADRLGLLTEGAAADPAAVEAVHRLGSLAAMIGDLRISAFAEQVDLLRRLADEAIPPAIELLEER
jgi:hypothetical protein